MKKSKRLVTLLLAVVLMVSLIALPVSALDGSRSYAVKAGKSNSHSFVALAPFLSSRKVTVTIYNSNTDSGTLYVTMQGVAGTRTVYAGNRTTYTTTVPRNQSLTRAFTVESALGNVAYRVDYKNVLAIG